MLRSNKRNRAEIAEGRVFSFTPLLSNIMGFFAKQDLKNAHGLNRTWQWVAKREDEKRVRESQGIKKLQKRTIALLSVLDKEYFAEVIVRIALVHPIAPTGLGDFHARVTIMDLVIERLSLLIFVRLCC